jgi:predicted NBD/HSP70 family sugar kinase
VGAPAGALAEWREFDLQSELKKRCGLPVFHSNDATAACGAELIFGKGREHFDYVYFFIGSFAGGGIVLGGSLFPGRSGNAGALGSMPIPVHLGGTTGRKGGSEQLIRSASLFRLEKRLQAEGDDPGFLFSSFENWDQLGTVLHGWIEETAEGLAYAITAAVSVVDFGAAIIDGGFPAELRQRLVARVNERLMEMDLKGLTPFQVIEGSVGANARSIGAATLPLFARFLLDRDVLFKAEA